MSHTKATLTELEQMLPTMFATPFVQPFLLLGGTGTGKSQWVKTVVRQALADSLGLIADDIGLVVERVSNRDACELAGVALPVKGADGRIKTEYTKPPLITLIENTKKEHGVAFLDETPQSTNDVQKVLADALDRSEHSIGGWDLPPGWIVVAAGNRTIDKSGANRMLAHLTDRINIFEIESDVEGWARWATDNGVHPLIIGCALQYKDDTDVRRNFFAEGVPVAYEQYCSFRSATYASNHLTSFLEINGQDAPLSGIIVKLIESNIGAGATALLVNYSYVRDNVPTGADIQADPLGAMVSTENTGYQMIAANNAIASAVDSTTADNAFAYIQRLTRADLKITMSRRLQAIMSTNGWVTNSDIVAKFNAKHAEVL